MIEYAPKTIWFELITDCIAIKEVESIWSEQSCGLHRGGVARRLLDYAALVRKSFRVKYSWSKVYNFEVVHRAQNVLRFQVKMIYSHAMKLLYSEE